MRFLASVQQWSRERSHPSLFLIGGKGGADEYTLRLAGRKKKKREREQNNKIGVDLFRANEAKSEKEKKTGCRDGKGGGGR